MKSLIIMSLFLSLGAYARLSDGKATLQVEKTKLVGHVAAGFHFNKEAPASLMVAGQESTPVKKEEKELIFDLSKAEGKSFQVSFYVCDDKKTVCEEHKYDYMLKSGKLLAGAGSAVASASVQASQEKSVKSDKVHMNSHGFIENNIEAALKKADKEKKLVLVDYGAPWCPACVRLETEVFGTKEFKGATKKLVKVALNSDLAANKAFGDKYQIKALPTLLILNAQGEELYRSLDFKPAKSLSQELTVALKKTTSLVELEKQAEAGDRTAQMKMAENAFNKLDMAAAVKWYEKLQDKSAFYAYAEMGLWAEKNEKDKKDRDGYIQVLKKWIAQDPNSYTAASARNDLAALYAEDKKGLPEDVKAELNKNMELLPAIAGSAQKSHEFFTAWSVSDLKPFEQEEVMSVWLSSAKSLKKDDIAKQIVTQLKDLLTKKDLSAKRPGEIMTGQSYFRTAGMKAEEEAWLVKLVEAYPDTYVYHMRLARFYSRNKEHAKALPEAVKAVELGPEWRLQNLQLLAQTQKELNQKEEAKKSIERALALPEAKLERYKKIAQSLEELKKTL
ncbi:thioredoxin family protein [Bdellovibrio sp. HCB-162]|uniref:thioredoxin family protein n=1 Tax=Bdellovibrio sp. HCB-162 TaxID=3394234 RepID=UPI0039BD726E